MHSYHHAHRAISMGRGRTIPDGLGDHLLCILFQERAAEEDAEQWSLSRFNPVLQEVIEDLAAGQLSADDYPYVRAPVSSDSGALLVVWHHCYWHNLLCCCLCSLPACVWLDVMMHVQQMLPDLGKHSDWQSPMPLLMTACSCGCARSACQGPARSGACQHAREPLTGQRRLQVHL